MKTTIYELLGMIKDGKAPKKIMYDNQIWNYRERTDMEGTILFKEYINEETDRDLFDEYLTLDILNEEVTILETTITYNQDNKQDKITKIDRSSYVLNAVNKILTEEMIEKINALIDRVNDMEV